MDGSEPFVIHGGYTGQGMHADIYCLYLTNDGKILVTGTWDDISQWDVETGTLLRMIYWTMEYVYTVALSPDDTILASGNNLHTILLWDMQTGQLLHTLEGHTGAVLSVDYSPDGSLLASSSKDGVRIWDAQTGTLLKVLDGHTDYVSRVTFSPDGTLLASGGWDGDVVLWGVPEE
jgi:WD40 repeat protein